MSSTTMLPILTLDRLNVPVQDLDKAEELLETYVREPDPERPRPVGFDTEFKTRVKTKAEQSMSKAQRLEYQKNKFDTLARIGRAPPESWDDAGIRMLQMALDEIILTFDLKGMGGFPPLLRRIMYSESIPKVGVGLVNDGHVLWEDVGCNVRRFVDIGHMLRIANPEPYATFHNNVSLEQCVEDVLHLKLDKDPRSKIDWAGDYWTPDTITYAALDAQASLQLYQPVSQMLQQQQYRLGRTLPEDWYTFNFINGVATRIVTDYNGNSLPWNYTVCPWYVSGSFSNYHY